MRPFVAPANAVDRSEREQFASDLQYYLALTPKQLPSRYLYDALGSALFEAICHLPWYRITRAEQDLLAGRGREILACVDPVSTVVELGPGSGEKLATLLEHRRRAQPVTVHFVDVSAAALAVASRTVGVLDGVDVVTHQAAYEAGLAEAVAWPSHGGRRLTLFLGSNIGNFDPPGADELLCTMRAALAPGDALLIGTDLVKPEADLLLAYDDPLGVTAAFNRNLLLRINRELDADFQLDAFRHRALWNAAESRVEMHLVAESAQRVRVSAASLEITLEAGETIWTESSYKYRPDRVAELLKRAGFRVLGQWVGDGDGFALTLGEV